VRRPRRLAAEFAAQGIAQGVSAGLGGRTEAGVAVLDPYERGVRVLEGCRQARSHRGQHLVDGAGRVFGEPEHVVKAGELPHALTEFGTRPEGGGDVPRNAQQAHGHAVIVTQRKAHRLEQHVAATAVTRKPVLGTDGPAGAHGLQVFTGQLPRE
jgi:hypothetical protein